MLTQPGRWTINSESECGIPHRRSGRDRVLSERIMTVDSLYRYPQTRRTTRWLRFVALGVVVGCVLSAARSVEAGIVTAMGDTSGMIAEGASSSAPQFSQVVLQLLYGDVRHYASLTQSNAPISSSSTSSSTSNFGSGQSPLAISETILLGGLPCSGWITPETVEALPPLLPSGLFRPPCA
jgi:hypothetical protein